MKLSKLCMLGCAVMALVFIGCSGEDGERGPEGPPGQATNGENGENGTDCWDLNGDGVNDADEDINQDGAWDALDCQGEQGEQGNANVQQVIVDLTEHTGTLFVQTVNALSEQVLEEDAVLYYLVLKDIGQNQYFSIPGLVSGDFEVQVYSQVEYVQLNFYNPDGQGSYPITTDDNLDHLKIMIIDGPSLVTKSGESTTKALLAELESAGIDVNDYNAVADYFGLE